MALAIPGPIAAVVIFLVQGKYSFSYISRQHLQPAELTPV